jgi:hypothetical protein
MTEKHIKAIVGSEQYDAASPEMEMNRIVKNRSNYQGRLADGVVSMKKGVECKIISSVWEVMYKSQNHFSRVCSSALSANSAKSQKVTDHDVKQRQHAGNK